MLLTLFAVSGLLPFARAYEIRAASSSVGEWLALLMVDLGVGERVAVHESGEADVGHLGGRWELEMGLGEGHDLLLLGGGQAVRTRVVAPPALG
ncbi:MAG TPA: hypothetical protein VG371_15775 [Solirubrobacteraceae bacterium]|nr:hypothetical protein [Solirubrobacteraceae bacterium]